MLFYFRYNQLIREYHKEGYFETILYKLKITRNLLEKFGLYNISKFQCWDVHAIVVKEVLLKY